MALLSAERLLIVRRVVREQLGTLHRLLLAVVRDDDVCRRLMTIPGVGHGSSPMGPPFVPPPAAFEYGGV
jgi:hypothetical protein